MKRLTKLTIAVATNDSLVRDQVSQVLSARNYRVVHSALGPSLLALHEAEPHDVAIVIPDGSPESLEEYRTYRRALGAEPTVRVLIAGGAEAARPVADELKDRFVAGPIERESLLHAIEAATRHLLTILVADDEPLIRKMFSMFLAGQGYKVVAAEDGADALNKVREVLPDLVITDIKMPHVDGYELCRAIKEIRETQHIPVIIVSAMGTELDVERGFNAGANEYMTKPVDLHDLGQRIQGIFRGIALRGRERVLVAVHSQIERSVLDYGLRQQGFEVEVVRDGDEAIEAARRSAPGVIVADFDLGISPAPAAPAGAGTGGATDIFHLAERLKGDRVTRDLPLVVLVGRNQKVDAAKRERLDAAALMSKPYSAERLVAVIERILGERRTRQEAESKARLQAIIILVTVLESRDKYTRGHSENVARYSTMIARHVYESDEDVARLHLSARLHDIGKIAVPDAILLKPGKLTDAEMDKMKTHPMEGVRILTQIPSLQDIIPGVRWHHERLDGKGYPDGLKGPEIPLQARIIAVGDTFDALTSHRPYRRGCPVEKAIEILKSAAGAQLDPALVDIFVREVAAQQITIPVPAELV